MLTCIVLAFIVLACVGLACVVLACVVLACVVLTFIVMACIVLACVVLMLKQTKYMHGVRVLEGGWRVVLLFVLVVRNLVDWLLLGYIY